MARSERPDQPKGPRRLTSGGWKLRTESPTMRYKNPNDKCELYTLLLQILINTGKDIFLPYHFCSHIVGLQLDFASNNLNCCESSKSESEIRLSAVEPSIVCILITFFG